NVILTDEKAVVEMYQNEFERLRVGTEIVERKQEPVTQIQPPAPLKAAPQEEIKTEELKADTGKQDSKSWLDFLSTYPKKPPPPSPAEGAPEKEFLDISFEELDKIFGNESTLSKAEKNEKWEQYKGKYVRWTGEVVYRGIGRTDWNRMGVKHTNTDKLDVELWFDYRMMDTVLSINKGNIITYTGMLSIRRGYNSPYRIKNAWIEEYLHQKP
ncbi:MAG: hypothetical protein HYW14_05805, partial [Planctomycetes bacterium]|nr:hypothetical protein [Planctomycetota bacterium]